MNEIKQYEEIHQGRFNGIVGSTMKLSQIRNSIVLDVGCGYGPIFKRLYDPTKGNKFFGIDMYDLEINPRLFSYSKVDLNFPFARNVPLPEQADIAFCFDVLENLKDPVNCLAELKKLVKPYGSIFISVPFEELKERAVRPEFLYPISTFVMFLSSMFFEVIKPVLIQINSENFEILQEFYVLLNLPFKPHVNCLTEEFFGRSIRLLTDPVLTPEQVAQLPRIKRPSMRTLEGKKDLVGVEIGVERGLNSLNLLENLDIKTLYVIDPYHEREDIDVREVHLAAQQTLSKYSDKIVWILTKSEDAHKLVPTELDFVYVDGDHSYGPVMDNIKLYYPKVKGSGVLGGHDFNDLEVRLAVMQALPEFVKRDKLHYHDCLDNRCGDWWIIKEEESLIGRKYN